MNRVFELATFVPKTCARRLSVMQVKGTKADISKIKKKQMQFQEDNGVPIYLKAGATDYVLYYSTIGLIFLGLGASIRSAYMLATKK